MLLNAERAAAPTAVSKILVVDCSLEKAFAVFTDRMGAWWPASHHIGSTPFHDILIEHRTGGRWYEISGSGEQCQWGYVLAWDPPHRLVISWHLGPDWTFDPEIQRASEVEVKFSSEAAGSTRVEFTHRHLDRHGVNHGKLRAEIDSPGGWTAVLAAFAQLVEERAQ